MIDTIKALLRKNTLCVLATCSENKPHCSLMQYVLDDRATTVYMVTLDSSRKYRNILLNPYVSLLVDSRAQENDSGKTKALTATGTACLVTDKSVRDLALARIAERHPALGEFLDQAGLEVIAIRIESFLLLEGPTRATFVEVRD